MSEGIFACCMVKLWNTLPADDDDDDDDDEYCIELL